MTHLTDRATAHAEGANLGWSRGFLGVRDIPMANAKFPLPLSNHSDEAIGAGVDHNLTWTTPGLIIKQVHQGKTMASRLRGQRTSIFSENVTLPQMVRQIYDTEGWHSKFLLESGVLVLAGGVHVVRILYFHPKCRDADSVSIYLRP